MRLTAITFEWADGEYTFDLKLGEVRKLQDKTGLGPAVILRDLQNENWKVDHYRETLLQGLLGGGMDAKQANKLVREWVDERPAQESIIPAVTVLMSWILGAPEPKKEVAPQMESEAETAPGASTTALSTEPEPQSDSAPAK